MTIQLSDEIKKDEEELGFVQEFAEERKVIKREYLREALLGEAEEMLKLGEKLFGTTDYDKHHRRFQKLVGLCLGGQEKGGAPLSFRALVVLVKLCRVPREVILKEEIEIEKRRQFERPIGGRKEDYQFTMKSRPRAAFETARKRIYRVLKHHRELGLPTCCLSLEQWESLERFTRLVKKAGSSSDTSYGIGEVCDN